MLRVCCFLTGAQGLKNTHVAFTALFAAVSDRIPRKTLQYFLQLQYENISVQIIVLKVALHCTNTANPGVSSWFDGK